MYKILDKVINFIEKNMKTRRVELRAGGGDISLSEDPKKDIPGRCTVAITICNCHNATQPHTQKMHSRIRTS